MEKSSERLTCHTSDVGTARSTVNCAMQFRNKRIYSMAQFEFDEHAFTANIREVLETHFGEHALSIFAASPLLGYLNHKTRAANRGSKARGSFANHYALYVLVEDYVKRGFADGSADQDYSQYEGARFSDLLSRQRELPFGATLQNHALNSRLNDEFRKFYPTVNRVPVVRDLTTRRYWIQEDLLEVAVGRRGGREHQFNIARAVIEIVDLYVATKKAAFAGFLATCREIAELGEKDRDQATEFIERQLAPNVDARVFEIVSYAVLKAKYAQESVWIGMTRDTIYEEYLVLYKTGRTNANDGGIDFVMRPIGRFFQVTETLDLNKYFLDIDKVQRFPITFVIKSSDPVESIRDAIRQQAIQRYRVDAVVSAYMNAVEEIINIDDLKASFGSLVKSGKIRTVMDQIISQSTVEFDFGADEST